MALYTADDYDLNEVGIPITGMAAFAPLAAGNVIADEDMGKPDITFPAAYRRLGLYKEDGGAEEGRDDKDATEFFQQGYKFPGESTQTVKIGLAEDNPNVNALIDGKEPDANGVVYVDSSLPSTRFLLFVATRYKNGRELRRLGVARIKEVEVDQEERGSVKAKSVTFEWSPDPLLKNAPFKKWLGIPGGIKVHISAATAKVKVNTTVRLSATTEPAGQVVTWTTSDKDKATVVDGLVKTSAAWLIDHAGFAKGYALPGSAASLSTRHVLALTNRGGARAADIAALRDAVVAGVRERYGITLVPEPVAVGW